MLQRNISVLLCRIGLFFGLQLLQGADDAEAGVTRFYHIINVAILRRIIRVGEQLGVFGFLFRHERFAFGSAASLASLA